ncbi:MAG: terminase family protein [Patescibacteria group bacterium]
MTSIDLKSMTTEGKRAHLRELMELQALRFRTEKWKQYVPIGKGEEFINMAGSDKYFVSLLSAANGIGKTCLLVNMLAQLFWPTENPFFQNAPLFQKWPYLKKFRIISDPTTVKQAIIPEMKAWFPYGRYKTNKAGKQYEYNWTTDTGWSLDVMTYDQDLKEFESATIGGAWLDEPPPESIFKATVSRFRRGGVIWITATPLTGSAWMYDYIIGNPKREEQGRAFIEADVWSASRSKGVRGFLDDAIIDKMIAQYSEDDKQARVFGKFQHLTGLVFKKFDPKIHVIKPFNVDMRNFTVYEALDPHPRTPDATVWIAVDRKGTKFIVDELFIKATTEELASRIKSKASQYRVERRIGDPSMFIVDQHTNKSLAQRLSEQGLHYLPATKARAMSDRRIGDALNFQQVGDQMLVAPELYVFDTCVRTIFEFQHYQWQEWTGKQADFHDQKERPMDKDDHCVECIGRLLYQEPPFVPYVDPNARQSAAQSLDPYDK